MQVRSHFLLVATISLGLIGSACSPPTAPAAREAPRAVRVAQVRVGPLVQGRRHLAEVVPDRTVKVIAQVPGTVSTLLVAEGGSATRGAALVRISAPDVAARVARVRSERKRAERERDFACSTVKADRVLAKSGDLPSIQLERSERGCASAELAVSAASAAEREASVAKARGVERAAFDGEVLVHLVDEGQTVRPGSPLLQYASRERLLRMRVPESDLEGIELGGQVASSVGSGRIARLGRQALGPGRVIEVLIAMDQPIELRVGTTVSATLIIAKNDRASAVPDGAIAGVDDAHYVMVVDGDKLLRREVALGVRADGWTAVEPALPAGSRVVVGALATLDPDAPILVVQP